MKDLYFIDETTKIIFALVELPGKISKNWYEETKNKIINSKHPKLVEAMRELEKLYKGMK